MQRAEITKPKIHNNINNNNNSCFIIVIVIIVIIIIIMPVCVGCKHVIMLFTHEKNYGHSNQQNV